jgi:SAM-dependent methyltransferase
MTLVTLGPSASEQWLCAPEHLAMVLARYRSASALIGTARSVLEVGCGEGIGARILAHERAYLGVDPDIRALDEAARLLGHPSATGDPDHALDTDLIQSSIEALAARYRADAVAPSRTCSITSSATTASARRSRTRSSVI